MENEHLPSGNPSSKPEKPPRSKLERAIVWTLIGLLLVFVGIEALAKTGYNKTVADLQTTIDSAEAPLTLDDFQSKIKNGLAVQGTGERDGIPTVFFTWPSLVKKYQLHFTVNGDEQTLATFATGTDPAESIRYKNKAEDTPEGLEQPEGAEGGPASHMETGAEAGGSGQGGSGQGGSGQGGRGGRNPFQQLVSEPVLAELQVTEEQKTQLADLIESQQLDPMLSPEERAKQQAAQRKDVENRLKELLNEQQFARARQILLHARGLEALVDDEVAAELTLTAEQREQIAAILASHSEKQQAIREQAEREAIREQMAALREETNKELLAVLTDEQKTAWETLLGPAPPEPSPRPQRPE